MAQPPGPVSCLPQPAGRQGSLGVHCDSRKRNCPVTAESQKGHQSCVESTATRWGKWLRVGGARQLARCGQRARRAGGPVRPLLSLATCRPRFKPPHQRTLLCCAMCQSVCLSACLSVALIIIKLKGIAGGRGREGPDWKLISSQQRNEQANHCGNRQNKHTRL